MKYTKAYTNINNCLAAIIFVVLFWPLSVNAQDGNDTAVIYDKCYFWDIKTIMLNSKSQPGSPPYLRLGDPKDRLLLQFDDLDTKGRQFQYTFIHCDADWRPSKLIQSDYMRGMFNDYINSDTLSSNTYKPYLHYSLTIPSGNVRPKLPGNYILKVYLDNESNVIFTRRFYVYDPQMDIGMDVKRATNVRYSDTKQEVDFTINTNTVNVTDPFADIKVVVKQNYRYDNEIRNLKPAYINGKQLVYTYQEENLFDAGNDFRPLDISNFLFKGNAVKFYTFDSMYSATLFPDEDRSYSAYSNLIDQDGAYTIYTKQGVNPATQADYCWVNFSLRTAYGQEQDKDVYVFGGLTDWSLQPQFKMNYDDRDQVYECSAILKQGFYDYEYVSVGKDGVINSSTYEGNHWETENTYTVLVYYRPLNLPTDVLLGIRTMKTTGK